MLGWFKGRNSEQSLRAAIEQSHAGKMLDQLALATAVSEVAAEYFRTQNNIPIAKFTDDQSSVMEIWIGTRLEAISHLWNAGAANLALIIDPTKHPKLLNAILRDRPFRPPREPRGEEIDDTIFAISKVYNYLHQLEYDLAVPTCSVLENARGAMSRYASFILEMQRLQPKWQAFEIALHTKADLPPQPETIFLPLWRDVTFRAKMIALCSQLGPSYMANMAALRKKVTEVNQDPTSADAMFVKILSADDPDKIQI